MLRITYLKPYRAQLCTSERVRRKSDHISATWQTIPHRKCIPSLQQHDEIGYLCKTTQKHKNILSALVAEKRQIHKRIYQQTQIELHTTYSHDTAVLKKWQVYAATVTYYVDDNDLRGRDENLLLRCAEHNPL